MGTEDNHGITKNIYPSDALIQEFNLILALRPARQIQPVENETTPMVRLASFDAIKIKFSVNFLSFIFIFIFPG